MPSAVLQRFSGFLQPLISLLVAAGVGHAPQVCTIARHRLDWKKSDTMPHAVLQRLPGFLQSLISLLVAAGVYSIDNAPNHVLVNSYGLSGAIPPHTDGEPTSACMPYKLTERTRLPHRCCCAEPASAGQLANTGPLQQPVRPSCTCPFACCKRILQCPLGATHRRGSLGAQPEDIFWNNLHPLLLHTSSTLLPCCRATVPSLCCHPDTGRVGHDELA